MAYKIGQLRNKSKKKNKMNITKPIISLFLFLFLIQITFSQTYINYAEGKPATASWPAKNASKVTDGSIATGAMRKNPRGKEVWVEIDLTAEFDIAGAHLYIDNRGILPLRDFSLLYQHNNEWLPIPGTEVTDNFKSQIELKFSEHISTNAIRLKTDNTTTFGVVELQVWGKDVPQMPYGVEVEEPIAFQVDSHWICVNQVAYNIGTPKRFTVPTAKTDLSFEIRELNSNTLVFEGKLQNGIGDFTAFNPVSNMDVEYVISLEGDGLKKSHSFPFFIGKNAMQHTAYQSTVDFFNDVRSIVGSHPSAYGGSPWRDGGYYTFEVPSLVVLYLSDPEAFDTMPVTMSWEKDKDLVFSDGFETTNEPNDDEALPTVKAYYTDLPEPKSANVPDIIQSIRFGVGWNLINPVSHDPSGDPLGKKMHSQTIEKLAYFLYGYPAYQKYIKEDLYKRVLDSTLIWWETAGLFDVKTRIGTPKGRHCPGHSVIPNLLMYEVAKRENISDSERYLAAAINQTKWIVDNADWKNPAYTKGQRISEHKLITGLTYFMEKYPGHVPAGVEEAVKEWAEEVISLSDNMWDFRRFDSDENWTLPGYNDAGNVIGFPACAISVARVIKDVEVKERLFEIAIAHFDNFSGRNPQNAHCANHPELGFIGVDRGWPYGDPRRDICARLEHVRGSLSSLPGTEMYPFNPNGRPRHGEGWTVYNANWNLSLAYLNLWEGITDEILKLPEPIYSGLDLYWSEEFNNSILDTKKWAYRMDVKHRSVQLKENVSVSNGTLKLNLKKLDNPIKGKFAAGAGIVSKEQFKYGYYEVRAKLGTGTDSDSDGIEDDGWHHSFWAQAAHIESDEVNTTYPEFRRTEIDCFENASVREHVKESGLNRFTQHIIVWNKKGKEAKRIPQPPKDIVSPDNFKAFEWHTYGFKWDKEAVTFYVDGKVSFVASYPSDKYEHDRINVWLTAISANWCNEGAETSLAEYDYFRYYK